MADSLVFLGVYFAYRILWWKKFKYQRFSLEVSSWDLISCDSS